MFEAKLLSTKFLGLFEIQDLVLRIPKLNPYFDVTLSSTVLYAVLPTLSLALRETT